MVYVIIQKEGNQKRFLKAAWEKLGKSTNGWEFVRNEDDADTVIPKSEIGKAKTSADKYIPTEVKSMKQAQKQEELLHGGTVKVTRLGNVTTVENVKSEEKTIKPVDEESSGNFGKLPPVDSGNELKVSNPAGEPADFNSASKNTNDHKVKAVDKPKVKSKPGPKPKAKK